MTHILLYDSVRSFSGFWLKRKRFMLRGGPTTNLSMHQQIQLRLSSKEKCLQNTTKDFSLFENSSHRFASFAWKAIIFLYSHFSQLASHDCIRRPKSFEHSTVRFLWFFPSSHQVEKSFFFKQSDVAYSCKSACLDLKSILFRHSRYYLTYRRRISKFWLTSKVGN